MQQVLNIRNDIQSLPLVNEWIEQCCEEAGLGLDWVMKFQLVIEEMVSNVIFYAYDSQQQEAAIELRFTWEAGTVSILLRDWGKPFDPTAKEDPDITLSADDRPIGGLGIFMVKQLMDEVRYERVGSSNLLTLQKRIN